MRISKVVGFYNIEELLSMNTSLRASTLVELMVTMIVAGITILIVMNGLDLLVSMYSERIRYLRSFGERVENFYRLDELICYADSIDCGQYGKVTIWKNNRQADVSVCDSSLICRKYNFCDTLIHKVVGLRMSSDSILIDMANKRTLSFPVPVPATTGYMCKIDSIECNFKYENDKRY